MSDILIDIAMTWVRYGAMALTVYLIEHHIVTAPQGDELQMELVKHMALILPGALALGWATMKTIWTKRAVLTALWMPKGSTEQDLKAQIKTGVTPTVMTPPNTIPGVPLPPK